MFQKIYNLVFSDQQREYQRQAYAALSLWESYRGWLLIIFSLSWLISIFIFEMSLWSVLFLAPWYALLLYLAYQGRAGAMVLLIVFWLMEKLNNLAYWFFDYYKLAAVLVLGIIFLPLAFNALKIELSRTRSEEPISSKKSSKVFLVVSLLLIFWLLALGFYHYYPFWSARRALVLENKDKQTKVMNRDFNFSFMLNDNCQVDGETLNHLIDDSIWAGKLKCRQNGDLALIILAADYALVGGEQELEGFEGVYTYDQDKSWNIIIVKPFSGEKLLIGGNEYNKGLRDQILDTIKPVK